MDSVEKIVDSLKDKYYQENSKFMKSDYNRSQSEGYKDGFLAAVEYFGLPQPVSEVELRLRIELHLIKDELNLSKIGEELLSNSAKRGWNVAETRAELIEAFAKYFQNNNIAIPKEIQELYSRLYNDLQDKYPDPQY